MKNQIFLETFSNRLRFLRKSKNLKQVELANQLDISITTIAKIETGTRSTSIDKLLLIADYFDVSCDWLLGRKEDE